MHFTKMEGLGNDYIFVDCTKEAPTKDLSALAVRLSDRHFGVGGDGLICLVPSKLADLGMLMFNADGSRGEMCGNGVRCAAKYAWDRGLVRGALVHVETGAGVREVRLHAPGGRTATAEVDMGTPRVEAPCVLRVGDGDYPMVPVSMGNPHIVYFADSVKEIDLTDIGPRLERHPRFPDRVNVGLAEVLSPDRLLLRVWERGSGETLACGTGACAAVAAAVTQGLTGHEVRVSLPGGDLTVRWETPPGHIYLTGPATTVFEGEWPEEKTWEVPGGPRQ